MFDECGVCGGLGIAEGACDCDGSQLDAIGVCGGDCPDDYNGNGICDTEDLYGCTYLEASNYNSEATSDDGSCIYDECDPNAGFDSGFDSGFAAGVEFVDCPDENSCPSDLDGNGHVSTADLLLFLSDFGSVCE
jgi:hypothetical protein